jgi:hypothetical protein
LGLVVAPRIVVAQESASCEELYRQLRAAPEIIGSTQEMRRYAQELGQKNNDIRQLRIELRRSGCGGGSIVRLGDWEEEAASNCAQMRQDLRALEDEREALAVERRSRLNLLRSSDERSAILAAIREQSCPPSDPDEQEQQQEERTKIQGLELPSEDDSYSGTTDLRTRQPRQQQTAEVAPPPVPDRPYDPNKRVRTVGPTFFPEENIDLAHPNGGPQAQQ